MKYRFVILLLFNCSLLSVAQPVTVSIPASADNTIYENPSGNSNALGQNIFSGNNGGGSPRRGLIKFDVGSVIPAGVTVTDVSLTLNCNVSRTIPDNIFLHKLLSAWGEGTSDAGGGSGDGVGVAATNNDATWLNSFFSSVFWTNPGGDFNATSSASVSVSATGFYTWQSTQMVSDVQSWLDIPTSNNGWILICNESAVATARKFGSRQNTTVANRPVLSVTYSSTLPITLSYFGAEEKNSEVSIKWKTLQEINNCCFEVQQSIDGFHFNSLTKINGQGNSAVPHEYGYKYVEYVSGIHYYRLLQIDKDNRRTFSSVRKINVLANSQVIRINPNPVLNEFRITSDRSLQKISYRIYNTLGILIRDGADASEIINVSTLQNGFYYLRLFDKNK
ncbi:MAG: DNRLRE domain-containing protein, partial [Ginsengibacter sp.]